LAAASDVGHIPAAIKRFGSVARVNPGVESRNYASGGSQAAGFCDGANFLFFGT
jgi:hypothetical protein